MGNVTGYFWNPGIAPPPPPNVGTLLDLATIIMRLATVNEKGVNSILRRIIIISGEMFTNVNGHLFGKVLIFWGWVALGWGGGIYHFCGAIHFGLWTHCQIYQKILARVSSDPSPLFSNAWFQGRLEHTKGLYLTHKTFFNTFKIGATQMGPRANILSLHWTLPFWALGALELPSIRGKNINSSLCIHFY